MDLPVITPRKSSYSWLIFPVSKSKEQFQTNSVSCVWLWEEHDRSSSGISVRSCRNFIGYKVQAVKLGSGALDFHLWNVPILSRVVPGPDPRERSKTRFRYFKIMYKKADFWGEKAAKRVKHLKMEWIF